MESEVSFNVYVMGEVNSGLLKNLIQGEKDGSHWILFLQFPYRIGMLLSGLTSTLVNTIFPLIGGKSKEVSEERST